MGFHKFDLPKEKAEAHFIYCEGSCGSYVRWDEDAVRYGYKTAFGKAYPFMIKETKK